MPKRNILFLFDVDGTLTPSRKPMPPDVLTMLQHLRQEAHIAFVGGSDIAKQKEQMGEDCLSFFDFGFPENGVSYYRNNKLISQERMIDKLGEENYKQLVNFCLIYLGNLDIPIKRGTFIECRPSMINISPIGRNCSSEERQQFAEYDAKKKIREEMVSKLREKFENMNLQFSIGGQISIDCFPVKWDKRYCLSHIEKAGIKRVIFFGDKTKQGGNDYEIYNDPDVEGVEVVSPEDTIKKVKEILDRIKKEEEQK